MVIHSYKDLEVWKKSIQLVKRVYRLTEDFPQSEIYILTSQMRRCAISIPSNIAEGRRRGSKKDFHRMCLIAYGSGAELETQLIIARELKYGNHALLDESEKLLEEIMKMLNNMTRALRT